VVLHGGPGGTVYDFERLAGPRLESRLDRPVLYYEQRGSGRSDAPLDGAYSVPLLVDDLDRLRAALGIARMALLGISFGAELAASYAVAHPDRVDWLALEGPAGLGGPLAGDPKPPGFDAVARDAGQRARILAAAASDPGAVWGEVDRETVDRFLFHRPEAAGRVRALWDELAARVGTVNSGAMRAALERQPPRARPLVDELAELDPPTLILTGLWDRNVGVDLARDLATRLGRARLAVFEESAHFPSIEETERFVREVAEFDRAS
jgi:proline iminopeptidase